MALSLRPQHVGRYRDIVGLLVRYGRGDLVRHAGLDDLVEPDGPSPDGVPAKAEELAADLERLGPT